MIQGAAPPALTANGVTKRYGRRPPALLDVDLTIPAGGLTALVGPNGAGKSTLLRCWIGFERPTSGTVEVLGVDPWRDRRRALRHLAYVAQRPPLYRELSALEHLRLAATIRREFDLDFARARLAELGVPMEARTDHLSGGQAAQVAVALALGTRAPVLLLDEPLASLDPLARRELLGSVAHAARTQHVTVVLSSHVVGELDQVADRVLVLGVGRVVYEATVVEALAGHSVMEGPASTLTTAASTRLVSEIADSNGRVSCLLRTTQPSADDGRRASLEEVVLGYLSLDRRAPGRREDGRGC